LKEDAKYIKMDLDDLRVYKLAMQLAEKIWNIVIIWEAFAKYSI